MLTHERLLELLHYDPATGVWTWRVSRGGKVAGTVAGTIQFNVYTGSIKGRWIKVNNKLRRSSRLAFFYVTGRWPAAEIDHWDHDPLNDRWGNLREATRQENGRNRSGWGRLGVKGVSLLPSGRYLAQATLDKRKVHLGYFATLEEASAAFAKYEADHHGEFAVTNRNPSCPPIHSSNLPTISSPPLQSDGTNQQSDAPINPS